MALVRRAVLILGLLSACTLDARDLTAFRETASGPDKLRAVLRSGQQAMSLRALAALSLLDLPRKDVDGRALLFEELNALDARTRREIVPAFKLGLSTRMRTTPGQPPAQSAVLAKDAGVKLLAMLGDGERALLGTELLDWIVEDVPRRANAGEFSLEMLAKQVGPRSAPSLISALREAHAAQSVARIAAVIDAHAEPGWRARASERLVELEKAYRARPTGSTGEAEAALLTQRDLARSFLPALGRFADQPAVRARLVQIARQDDIPAEQRRQALDLLEKRTTPAETSALLELAQSERAPPDIRLLAMTRAGETRSRDILPGLLIVLANQEHAQLRQRAGELVLEIGGGDVLPSFFRSLPTAWDMPFDKREIDAYGERISRLPGDAALVTLLGNKLHSSFWYHRVLALRYFATRALAEDVWRLRQHVYDPHPVFGAGWPKGHTVGLEAESALARASERLHAAGGTSVWAVASGQRAANAAGAAARRRPAPAQPEAPASEQADPEPEALDVAPEP
jgi:hypothetical protein